MCYYGGNLSPDLLNRVLHLLRHEGNIHVVPNSQVDSPIFQKQESGHFRWVIIPERQKAITQIQNYWDLINNSTSMS